MKIRTFTVLFVVLVLNACNNVSPPSNMETNNAQEEATSKHTESTVALTLTLTLTLNGLNRC